MPRPSLSLPVGLLVTLALAVPSTAAAAPTATAAQGSLPKPAMKLSTFADRLERGLTTRGCPGLKTLLKDSLIRLTCPFSNRKLKAAFKGFKVTGVRQYGTGAVLDFTDGEAKKGASYVLALGPGRKWSIMWNPITNKRTTARRGTGPLAGHQNAIGKFLPAVRDGNCDEYFRYAITPLGEKKATSCRLALTPPDGFYLGLQEDLRANPNAQPVLMGGNRTFVFYALQTGATYRTLVSFKTPPAANQPYLVVGTERV